MISGVSGGVTVGVAWMGTRDGEGVTAGKAYEDTAYFVSGPSLVSTPKQPAMMMHAEKRRMKERRKKKCCRIFDGKNALYSMIAIENLI
jgi:hypothetical protein